MASITLNPNATVSNTGAILGGAGSAHATLADASDATYVEYSDTDLSRMELSTVAMPAGAVTKTLSIFARVRRMPQPLTASIFSGVSTVIAFAIPGATDVAFVDFTSSTQAVNLSQAEVDALQLQLRAVKEGGWTMFDLVRAAKASVTLVYVPIPVVTLGVIAEPITDSTKISVTWSSSLDADGGAQTRYKLWVTDDLDGDAIVWDSGEVVSSAESAITGDLPPVAGTYTVHLQIAQTVNGSSLWSVADTQSGIDVSAPVPIISSVTAEADQEAGTITVTATRDALGQDWDRLSVERTDDGGVTWVPVWGATWISPPDPDTYTVVDYLAASSIDVTYRVRGAWLNGLGTWNVGEWEESNAVARYDFDCRFWVRAPGEGEGALVDFAEGGLPQSSETHRQGLFSILGLPERVAVSDAFQAPEGTITLIVQTIEQRTALLNVLRQPAVLFLPPAEYGWYDLGWATVSRFAIVRPEVVTPEPVHGVEVSYETVAMPYDPSSGVLT